MNLPCRVFLNLDLSNLIREKLRYLAGSMRRRGYFRNLNLKKERSVQPAGWDRGRLTASQT